MMNRKLTPQVRHKCVNFYTSMLIKYIYKVHIGKNLCSFKIVKHKKKIKKKNRIAIKLIKMPQSVKLPVNIKEIYQKIDDLKKMKKSIKKQN